MFFIPRLNVMVHFFSPRLPAAWLRKSHSPWHKFIFDIVLYFHAHFQVSWWPVAWS